VFLVAICEQLLDDDGELGIFMQRLRKVLFQFLELGGTVRYVA